MRTIKLEPQSHDDAIRSFHRDDNNRFNPPDQGWVVRSWLELTHNPDSYMLLMECGADGLPDPETEIRVPLHRGAQFVVDTQRLWHVVVHTGTAPRYALISSFESGPAARRVDRPGAPLDLTGGGAHRAAGNRNVFVGVRRPKRRTRNASTTPPSRIMPNTANGLAASVPAPAKCTVENANNGSEEMWTACHSLRGIRLRASDVSSTAMRRYMLTMPHATHTGCHDDVNGTSTSATPNDV